MRTMITISLLVLLSGVSFAQGPGGAPPKQDLIKDVFRGVIPEQGINITTILTLNHLPYADDGDFTLKETFIDAQKKERTANCFGEWTVLKGDAKDDNATVVELDAPGRIMYFLRLKNNNLLKLDTSLREIMPTTKYILRKDNGTLSGTYEGSMPCADCNRIETTLTLECTAPCKEGTFILKDKYAGTPKGDQLNTKKGKWNFAARSKMADSTKTIIVLDPDKAGRSAFYLVKEDGNLLPLDKDMKKPDGPFDGTLMRK